MFLWLSMLHADVSLAFYVTQMFLWLSMLRRCFFGFLCYVDVSVAFYVM